MVSLPTKKTHLFISKKNPNFAFENNKRKTNFRL